MTTIIEQTGIHLGDRGDAFKRLVKSLLKKGNVPKVQRKTLLSPKNMKVFASAFTSEQIDPVNNYQVLEQIGDKSAGGFIVEYFYERFPQLQCAKGVKVVARLLINYGSKNSFYKLADEAGFWEFISAPNEMRARKKKDLLEDTFEAYLGAVTVILNREALESRVPGGPITRPGYSACYNILNTLFDEMKISLAHEDLYDAKTRLKETFDMFGEKLGKNPAYKEQERGDDGLVYSTVYSVIDGKWNKIGDGVAAKKADAQQAAATAAIETLGKRGIRKMAPALYRQFSTGELKQEEVTEADVKRLITRPGFEEAPPGIDTLYQTRGKSKHQARYASTYLGKYCFEHNYGGIKACLSIGACPNVRDTYGLTAFDLLLTTSPGPRMVRHVLKKFLKKGSVMVSPDILAQYGELKEDEKYVFTIGEETVVISVVE